MILNYLFVAAVVGYSYQHFLKADIPNTHRNIMQLAWEKALKENGTKKKR